MLLKEIQSTGNKDTRSGFGDGIVEAARKNLNVVALTADLAGSLKLIPVDNSVVQGEFLARAIKMEASKYASLWTKKGFRGGASLRKKKEVI